MKLFESLKEKSPLYGRKNIVLTTNKSYDAKGAVVCSSVEEVLDAVKDYDDNDIYVIGGGEIYKEFLPYCDVAHITKIDYKYDADTYLENLDALPMSCFILLSVWLFERWHILLNPCIKM